MAIISVVVPFRLGGVGLGGSVSGGGQSVSVAVLSTLERS
jgi:hypothetical protein